MGRQKPHVGVLVCAFCIFSAAELELRGLGHLLNFEALHQCERHMHDHSTAFCPEMSNGSDTNELSAWFSFLCLCACSVTII